jgi:hypothetical protein
LRGSVNLSHARGKVLIRERFIIFRTIPNVNFINILLVPFSVESVLRSFPLVTVWLYNFWRKNIGAKAARKMLMTLTTAAVWVSIRALQNWKIFVKALLE